MTLPEGFELAEADMPKDLDAIIDVLEEANVDDELWKACYRNVKPEDAHKFTMTFHGGRYSINDLRVYKITEKATGKIVAYGAVQFPWRIRPPPEEFREQFLGDFDVSTLPPRPEGFDMDVFNESMGILKVWAEQCAYDPEKDFCRWGTMVRPEYQRRGLGTAITRHINEQADQANERIIVNTRYTSRSMFKKCGYKTAVESDAHVERWGGDHDKGVYLTMIREPGAV